VKQEFAGAERFVIPGTARHVLGNVGVNQPRAGGLEVDIGVANIGFAFAKGLNFGTMEDKPGLNLVEQVVIVGGGAVLGDDGVFFGVFALYRLLTGMF